MNCVRVVVISSLIFTASPCFAAAFENEVHNFGSSCAVDKANGTDWDTLFQCSGGTWQRAPYFFGATSSACSALNAGTVQWTGSAFQFCNGKSSDWSALTLTATGNVGIQTAAPFYPLDVNGSIRSNAEIISTNSNQFRMVYGSYGAFFRNDGSNTYLLLTNPNDQYGSWNGLRPFSVNDATGVVSMNSGLYSSTGIQLGSSSPCDSSHLGTIIWNGADFYGCKSTGWQKLGGACSPGQCIKSDGTCGTVVIQLSAETSYDPGNGIQTGSGSWYGPYGSVSVALNQWTYYGRTMWCYNWAERAYYSCV